MSKMVPSFALVLSLALHTFAEPSSNAFTEPSTIAPPGYYKVYESHGRLNSSIIGTQFYLGYETTQAKDHSIVKTPKAVFGYNGEIWSDCKTPSNCSVKWTFKASSFYSGTASMELMPNQNLKITLNYTGSSVSPERPEWVGYARHLDTNYPEPVAGKWDPTLIKTNYLAHRGVAKHPNYNPRSIYPGNSLEAFEDALSQGFNGFELDVQTSIDGVLFVSHDNDLSVSSNQTGKISRTQSEVVRNAKIQRTGIFPEFGFPTVPSSQSAPLRTLKEILDHFLVDPRVNTIVLDIKPKKLEHTVIAMQELLNLYDPELLKKLVLLIKQPKAIAALRCEFTQSRFALEGRLGWEPLEAHSKSKYLPKTPYVASRTELLPQDQLPSETHDVISISAGIGLGFSGSIVNKIFTAIPSIVASLFRFEIDIRNVYWLDNNIEEFKNTTLKAKEKGLGIIGWTVSTPNKLLTLRQKAPDMTWLLTDMSYFEVARSLILERAEASRNAPKLQDPIIKNAKNL